MSIEKLKEFLEDEIFNQTGTDYHLAEFFLRALKSLVLGGVEISGLSPDEVLKSTIEVILREILSSVSANGENLKPVKGQIYLELDHDLVS